MCSDVPGRVEEWHTLWKQQISECATNHKHGLWSDWALNIRQSWRRFFDSESCFTAVQKECATPPHVQVRRTTWLSFTRPSPALVLQATNAGARRPGYEARLIWHTVFSEDMQYLLIVARCLHNCWFYSRYCPNTVCLHVCLSVYVSISVCLNMSPCLHVCLSVLVSTSVCLFVCTVDCVGFAKIIVHGFPNHKTWI